MRRSSVARLSGAERTARKQSPRPDRPQVRATTPVMLTIVCCGGSVVVVGVAGTAVVVGAGLLVVTELLADAASLMDRFGVCGTSADVDVASLPDVRTTTRATTENVRQSDPNPSSHQTFRDLGSDTRTSAGPVAVSG